MIKHLFGKISLLLLLLLGAVAALCIWRWDVFFSTTTERSYSLEHWTHPVMTAGEDGLHDRTISWACAQPDSCLMVLLMPDGQADTTVSYGTKVTTMGGEQYMHTVRLTGLEPGTYTCSMLSADRSEELMSQPFVIRDDTVSAQQHFCLFGDLLLDEDAAPGYLRSVIAQAGGSVPFDAILYTGNIIRESTHTCWAGWYGSMQELQAEVPQLGVPGSRDYERGICREIDPRWMHRFPMPLNGPYRFEGTSCYVDYPLCRMIFLDTETLELLADYTVLQGWLTRSLREAGDKWKIVVMHHSVHSVSAGFDHPRLYLALHLTLDEADLIVSGGDLTYGRRCDISLSDLFYDQQTVPVYMVLTSDSTEAVLPKCSPLDQRIGSNRAFFSTVTVTPHQLSATTRYIAYPDSIYDGFNIDRESKVVSELPMLPEEVIEKPTHYVGSSLRARRFEHLRDARLKK